MASRIAVLAVHARDVAALAGFWSRVLDWPIAEESPQGTTLAPPHGGAIAIDVLPVDHTKTTQNRLHLDLRATGGLTVAQELERLRGLGAVDADVGQPADAAWTVLADPEGNEFCLLHGPDTTP